MIYKHDDQTYLCLMILFINMSTKKRGRKPKELEESLPEPMPIVFHFKHNSTSLIMHFYFYDHEIKILL